jgi:hypothetical protein
VHRRAEEINETAKQWGRHRGLKLVVDHAEVVTCDISATANTLKSPTFVLASTVVTGRNSSELKVSPAARQCQRLRSTKVSIRSRSSACSRLVSTERPHRNLTVRRNARYSPKRRSELSERFEDALALFDGTAGSASWPSSFLITWCTTCIC